MGKNHKKSNTRFHVITKPNHYTKQQQQQQQAHSSHTSRNKLIAFITQHLSYLIVTSTTT